MQSFVLKANDSRPDLVATLEDASGPVDLTGATVQFRLASTTAVTDSCGEVSYAKNAVMWTKSGTVVDATAGSVKFSWSAADTTSPGYYLGEFVATFTGGAKQSFPTNGFIPVVIRESLS